MVKDDQTNEDQITLSSFIAKQYYEDYWVNLRIPNMYTKDKGGRWDLIFPARLSGDKGII